MCLDSNLSNGTFNAYFLKFKSYKHCNKSGDLLSALINMTKNVGGHYYPIIANIFFVINLNNQMTYVILKDPYILYRISKYYLDLAFP